MVNAYTSMTTSQAAVCDRDRRSQCRNYSATPADQSILYVLLTMLGTVMSNWFADYHHALLLHLLSGAVMLVVFCLGLLLSGGFRSARRFTRHIQGRL
jgi:hypothetical protein